jgi:hypothetical protein
MASQGQSDVYTRYHDHDRVPSGARLLGDLYGVVRHNGRTWLKALIRRGERTPAAVRLQMEAVRSLAQIPYMLRLMYDLRLRELVERRDWFTP